MKAIHTIVMPDAAATLANQGQILMGHLPGQANLAGAGAGAAVVTAVAVPGLPSKYSVMVNPRQDATWFVSGNTPSGFNVTLNPRLPANTLAAGTFDLIIVA